MSAELIQILFSSFYVFFLRLGFYISPPSTPEYGAIGIFCKVIKHAGVSQEKDKNNYVDIEISAHDTFLE